MPEGREERSGSRLAAHVFGVGKGIASTVYGTITVMAALAAYGVDTHPWTLAGVVASTAFVLWIAHVHAHGVSESIELRSPLTPSIFASIARREVGILTAAALPTAALLLGAAGIVREQTAVWLALAIGLATLAAQGIRYARLESLGAAGTLKAVAANVALGLLVVALKVFLGHH